MIKTKVTGAEQAVEALRKAIEAFITTKSATVGIHEDESTRDSETLTNAQVGAFNEFGTVNIPARSWLVPGVESGAVDYIGIIDDTIQSGEPLDQALDKIGVVAVAKVQRYMRDLRTPPNAPSTIAKKKSSNPLIDIGELRQSVDYKIQPTKPSEGI